MLAPRPCRSCADTLVATFAHPLTRLLSSLPTPTLRQIDMIDMINDEFGTDYEYGARWAVCSSCASAPAGLWGHMRWW